MFQSKVLATAVAALISQDRLVEAERMNEEAHANKQGDKGGDFKFGRCKFGGSRGDSAADEDVLLPTSITGVFLLREDKEGELEAEGEIEGLDEESVYAVRLHHHEKPASEGGFCPMSNNYLEDPTVYFEANSVGQYNF